MINGPVTIGDSPTYTTNLRGRTYMKDVPDISNLTDPLYQPQVVVCYGPDRENWIVPVGQTGQALTLIQDGSFVKPMWIDINCCEESIPIGGSANFPMSTIGGTTNIVTSSLNSLIGRSFLFFDPLHPFYESEEFELYSSGPFETQSTGTTEVNIILETNVNSSYPSNTFQYIRRWSVKAVYVHNYSSTLTPPRFEGIEGDSIETLFFTDTANNGTFLLKISWEQIYDEETIMYLVLYRTPESSLLIF